MTKRAVSLLLVLMLCVGLTGCSAQQWRYPELTITLPGDFQSRSAEPYARGMDFLFENGTVAVAGIRETRQALANFGTLDAEAYAQLVLQANSLDCQITATNNLLTFSYEATAEGTALTYLCAIYEAADSFWQVQAYCASSALPANQDFMWDILFDVKIH